MTPAEYFSALYSRHVKVCLGITIFLGFLVINFFHFHMITQGHIYPPYVCLLTFLNLFGALLVLAVKDYIHNEQKRMYTLRFLIICLLVSTVITVI
jgi:hypothetical protein